MSGFEPNAILRGAQLTLVGANRALQNPGLWTSDHYRQAAIAVAAGLAIRIIIAIPIVGVRVLIWFLSFVMDLEGATWDNELIEALTFIEHSVLQVPFFLMTVMRYISPTLDNIFMDSLNWVDRTYVQKHQSENPKDLRAMYYPHLKEYEHAGHAPGGVGAKEGKTNKNPYDVALALVMRYGRRAGISLAIYALSFLPYVGRFVLPAASFYTFNKAVGPQVALPVFGASIFLPRKYLVRFLQSFFSSRSLMRDLLQPYFARVHYNKAQRKQWFADREGVLFGFALAFFAMIKVPLVGVLVYGIAEASTAYLITKITEPPPAPGDVKAVEHFKESDVRWKNKHEFLDLPFDKLDAMNIKARLKEQNPLTSEKVGKEFL